MADISFERAFSDTIKSLESRKFKLPPATATAVYDGLNAARSVYLAGHLSGVTTGLEYTFTLVKSMRELLNDPAAPPAVLSGYRIVERVLSYHCLLQAGDRSQQQRVDRVARELHKRVTGDSDKSDMFKAIAAMYITAYRRLTSVDLFSEDGHPIGRAAKAAQIVAKQFEGRRQLTVVTYMLEELRRLTREIDR